MELKTLSRIAENPAITGKAVNKYFSIKASRIEENRVSTKCWIPATVDGIPLKANKDGYVQTPIIQPSGSANRSGKGGLHITAYIHQLGWWRQHRFDSKVIMSARRLVSAGFPMSISHLCHNTRCFRPLHLTLEPNWVNIYRQTCRRRKGRKCKCHFSRRGKPGRYKKCLKPYSS